MPRDSLRERLEAIEKNLAENQAEYGWREALTELLQAIIADLTGPALPQPPTQPSPRPGSEGTTVETP